MLEIPQNAASLDALRQPYGEADQAREVQFALKSLRRLAEAPGLTVNRGTWR